MSAADARLLRAMSRALEPYETDMADLEAKANAAAVALKEHDERDTNRFLQLHQGMADLEHRMEFLLNMLTLTRDDMHLGLKQLGAKIEKKDPNEVTPPRRGTNGR